MADPTLKGRPGRPKGSKRDTRQFNISFWFNLLVAEYKHLTPGKRADIAFKCWQVLVNKAKSLPSSSADSRFNADEAMELLQRLESGKPLDEMTSTTDKPAKSLREKSESVDKTPDSYL